MLGDNNVFYPSAFCFYPLLDNQYPKPHLIRMDERELPFVYHWGEAKRGERKARGVGGGEV